MRLLSKDKILALSIAINVLLVFALSIFLYLVYPQFIYELESVNNWDRYSVRTYRRYEGGQACFEILMGHKRLYSYSAKQAFYVELIGTDITGNSMPNLVIRQWQGSAHGDSTYHILELDNSNVNEIDVVDGLIDVEFKDLNNDGIIEITGLDKAYSYFGGGCFTGSPLPFVVLSFDTTQAKFFPDVKLMSKASIPLDQLNTFISKYKKDPMWSEERRPPTELFSTMLMLIYSGNEEQAWELFEASWHDGSVVPKEQYKEVLKGDMRKSPFYPVISGWNKKVF